MVDVMVVKAADYWLEGHKFKSQVRQATARAPEQGP